MAIVIEWRDAIQEPDMSYLWLAPRLLQEHRATGMFRLGIVSDVVSVSEHEVEERHDLVIRAARSCCDEVADCRSQLAV
ncbi:flagellar transcriptional regulator FlhD [Burkholderia cepacia]|uniref:flagellar transcriptional regulator FlhD n=1 Tax=Burkholderia cepacia TaxID=292 RepID=UPI0009B98108